MFSKLKVAHFLRWATAPYLKIFKRPAMNRSINYYLNKSEINVFTSPPLIALKAPSKVAKDTFLA